MERIERFFNTTGPMVQKDHYCIDPLTRIDWEVMKMMIRDKRYFVLHAPRQTGKTSTLLAIMHVLNEEGRYYCAYANIEAAQTARDEAEGIPAVCSIVSRALSRQLHMIEIVEWNFSDNKRLPPQDQLSNLLEHWTAVSDKPTVLFIDEVDSLVGDTLISFLRQIRAGYSERPERFPQSIILCGVRDVRDYRIHQGGGEIIAGGSAFNIKAESLRMGNFSREETIALWRQYTEETGQEFAEEIFPELWEDTCGQPWLVNALAHELTWKLRRDRERDRISDYGHDYSRSITRDQNHKITLADYKIAREALIQSRSTHLDQLADKLREPRVRSIISAMLSGEPEEIGGISIDDQQYVEDLGLIVTHPTVRISNRIYQEIIPRELTWIAQTRITGYKTEWYITSEHRLNMNKLLAAFQQFFRKHSEIWKDGFDLLREAACQLLMQAFLQRIVNGGGLITREYGLGRKRTDLLIEWPLDEDQGLHGPIQRIVIEMKLRYRDSLESLIAKALEQTADYARNVGADDAHLIIFDRNPDKNWDERIWRREEHFDGFRITIWGA